MSNADDMIILIPARMAASRLPGKPMADIGGKPLIEHVWQRAVQSDIAPVVVATDHDAIYRHIQSCGGNAVMTSSDHASGSDRIYEALMTWDPDGNYQTIINLQGDLPTITKAAIAALADMMASDRCDLATLVARATDDEINRSQVVKAVISWYETTHNSSVPIGRAHYFSRLPVPYNAQDYWHHIGLYGWRRSALARFISLAPSPLETTEKLEQLRALEAGMIIDAGLIDEAPGGVDTVEDLEAVREILAPQ